MMADVHAGYGVTESKDLTMIDAGISSLSNDVYLSPNLTSLNLHCNFIKKIENLHALCNLQHLDLSSNQIKIVGGLDRLFNLKTLNLSSNQIEKVRGFANLTNLVKLNLSYNAIADVSGFVAFGPSHQLERVDLQGNKISSQKALIDGFRNCGNVRKLILRADGADNPVCSTKNYRTNLMTSLQQIHVLDWTDRAGNYISDHGSDVPGLDDFLAQILPSSSSEAMIPIETPKIDAAIDMFKHRHHDVKVTSESDSSAQAQKIDAHKQELDRLHRIEVQLAQLLEAREAKENQEPKKQVPKRDTDITDDSDSSEKPKRTASKPVGKKAPAAKLSKTPPSKRTLKSKQATARAEEASMKKEVESTHQHLVEDLNTERERRFKAEHASKQLADRVKQLQMESKLYDEKTGIAVEASTKMKEMFIAAREEAKKLREENDGLKEDLMDFQKRLEDSKSQHQSTLIAMRSMEESVAKIESEKCQTNAHYTKMINDSDAKAAAAHREIDILRVQIKEQKSGISQMQQLLAMREQEHKKELDQRYTMNSPEIQELLRKEANHVETLYQNRVATLQQEINTTKRQYAELEDEFRTALHIEANRYDKIHEAYTKTSEELETNRQELLSLRHKDEKGTQLVTELTQLVKEQKGRISELAKSKHDQLQDLKDRIQTLEAHLEEARRRIVQHELLKQDNKRMQAQLDAQESIIEGLRAERKLWGQELAQQGSSLAQDRGRLEAKIEALNHEISYLKKQLEKEVDSVKIKSKLIDDQTETIKHLKDAMVERDEQVKSAREEMLAIQRKFENELCDEKSAYRDAQEMLDSLTKRKQELKDEVRELENALEIEKENHTKINDKWREKADMIGTLENQVFEMKENWERKEKELVDEKEKALKAANLAIDKMRQMDNAFRKQYENTQKSHQEELRRATADKEEELLKAKDRIVEVEHEMRTLLKEQEEGKKMAEERVRKMGLAFSELQQQLTL